jgi:transposase
MVECAWGATRKKDGFLKRKYESLVGRRGKKKALVAVGHKIIVASYHVIKDKQAYKEPELHNNPKRTNKQIRNYMNRLKELGLDNSLMEALQETLQGRIFTEQQKVSRT